MAVEQELLHPEPELPPVLESTVAPPPEISPPSEPVVQKLPPKKTPVKKTLVSKRPLPAQVPTIAQNSALEQAPIPQPLPISQSESRNETARTGLQDLSLEQAILSWQQELLLHLERHKRYPRQARFRRITGITEIHFTMNRNGMLISSRLHDSSGARILDEAALDMVRRAQPLPTPPPEIGDTQLSILVPVRFSLR